MLDKSTLSQLKQLKQSIEDSKEYAQGIVKGTQRKFGFVVLNDGREIYLHPDEMQKVLPGDEVKILIENQTDKKTGKIKTSGQLLKLIQSPLKEFTGHYVVRGQGHFVQPDLPNISRWIFIPPASRKNAKPGDLIRCQLTRHPYPQAKPQAKIVDHIGPRTQKSVEADYMINKFQLEPQWPDNWESQLLEVDTGSRQDLTHIGFVTIDGMATQDMDDALYAKPTSDGWQLLVAIADPAALIGQDTELDSAVRKQAISCYLPGKSVPMLPTELATDLCSLAKEQVRPALVCTINIEKDGDVSSYEITEAMISSKAKLDYDSVAHYLDEDTTDHSADCIENGELLLALQKVSIALLEARRRNNLVIPDRKDYRLVLNTEKKLEKIEPQEKNSANVLVEECMIAANRCAADMLGDKGIFISHPGFRKERLADVKKLAEEQLDLKDIDFSTTDGYQQLMKTIDDGVEFPIRAVLSRLLERSRLSHTPRPHYGMGMQAYTTFTSPIRKYSDLLVHRAIKAKIHQQSVESINEEALAEIQLRQDNVNQARYQTEQWLKCDLLSPLIGKQFSGEVSQINSNGFTVRLNDLHIEGFVETKLLNEKYSFDPMRLQLKSKSQKIQLSQTIDVIIKEADPLLRRISFTLPKLVDVKKNNDEKEAAAI